MRLFLAALAVTALVGCSTVSKQVADEATDTTVMIDAALAKARSGNAKNDGTVRILDDQMFVPGAAMQLTPEKHCQVLATSATHRRVALRLRNSREK